MSEIYPSDRLAIRDSVTRILFDRPGKWLTTHEILSHCEEAETSDTLAKILSDMAKTGRLMRGLKALNAYGREVNTWGLSPKLRDKIRAGQLLAQSQDASQDAPAPAWQIDAHQTTMASLTPPEASFGTEPQPLPVEICEDKAASRAPETPTRAQNIRELMCSVPEYAALNRPINWTDEPDAPPARACKAHGLPAGFTLAEPDQPIETPQPWQETEILCAHLPERWLPELRLRLLATDGGNDPVIILRINADGNGAFMTFSSQGEIAFDPGEIDFLPSVGNALCQFVDALYPYGVKPGAK
jgi:hypothetical protein